MSVLNPQQLQMFMRPHEIMDKVEGSVEVTSRHKDTNPAFHKGLLRNHMQGKLGESRRPRSSADTLEERGNSSTPSLADSVATEGVKRPIILSTQGPNYEQHDNALFLGNGHHRLASAQFAEEQTGQHQYVPVIHDDNFMGSRQTKETFGVSRA